jgi:eukaryotic-like serine/threonine-protein kinase
MGKENFIPRSDPENPNKRVDPGGAHIDAAVPSAGGETTLDTGGSGAAAARAEDRMSIGPYVLVKKLGEGGMGQVWLSEQTAPVKRQVAMKLIKGGLYDSAVIQRFESERQSLAVMNHPAIAKVFDAGATKDGQPYFVMEYVDGLPITRYCDNKKLKIRERLELFMKVCEGVQHAHQKAIIHRDLKPSNVLVVEVDGKPVPRIIDFGLAKAITTHPGAEHTLFTEAGALVGTRGFMSPEQADPSVQDIDTRTDVYSLGVILYVLLTGMLPFDSEEWKKRPLDENLRQLREEDPPSPAAKLVAKKEAARNSASNRAVQSKQLVSLLRGDLNWITLKALERDRARRYGTPFELASDIERYLENRPVVAGPASKGYRLRMYVRRHRVGASVASGVALLLIAFAVAQAVQLRRITRERDRADRITDFMAGMFAVPDPSASKGNNVTAREILDKATIDIDKGLEEDPEVRAQMLQTMGRTYDGLGLYPRAQELYEHALDIQRRVLGPKDQKTLNTSKMLAWTLYEQGHNSDAEKMLRQTAEVQRQVLGPRHPDTLATMNRLGWTLTLQGHYDEAEKLLRETLEVERRVLGPDRPETLATIYHLAATLSSEGHLPEAETLEREVLDRSRRVLGPEHPMTLTAMNMLAWNVLMENKAAEAEQSYRELLALDRSVLGPEHPNTLWTMRNIAVALESQGRVSEAQKMYEEALDSQRRVLGPEHPHTLATMNDLAILLRDLHHYPEAEKLLREAIDVDRRIRGLDSPQTLLEMANLGWTLRMEGRYAEAEKLSRDTTEAASRALGPDNPTTLLAMGNLANTLRQEGRYADAEKAFREVIEKQQRLNGLEDSDTLEILTNLGITLSYENRFPEAEKQFHEIIEMAGKRPGPRRLAFAWYGFACAAAVAGHRDEAFQYLRQAIGYGGYGMFGEMASDENLKSLRNYPRFKSLLKEVRQHPEEAQKPS